MFPEVRDYSSKFGGSYGFFRVVRGCHRERKRERKTERKRKREN